MRAAPRRVVCTAAALALWIAGPPAAQAQEAGETCFADVTGDTASADRGAGAYPRADIVEHCLVDDSTLSVWLKVAEPTDPAADPNWDAEETFASWGLDTDGDGAENYTVVYGVESTGTLEVVVVDAATDVEVCSATPLTDGRFGAQGIDRSCIADAPRVAVAAGMSYDSDAAVANAPVWGDFAPDDGSFVGAPATAAACEDAPSGGYADRDDARSTHRRNVDCVLYLGIARGSTRDGQRFYRPRSTVTRGQMASFIVNTLVTGGHSDRLPAGDGEPEFSDIGGTTHERAINRLARAAVVSGTGEGKFSPNATVTRQQMASFIVHAVELAREAELTADGTHFGDVSETNPHRANINAGFENALFAGTSAPQEGVPDSGRFSPGTTVQRDQMASFLVNLLRAL